VIHQRRFGPEFVAEHRRRFGALPPDRRQLTYDIAAEPHFESWREWYDEQLAVLPQADADKLARRLWLDESFWPVTIELAAGAALRNAGHDVVYERAYFGLTPDWTAIDRQGRPLLFVEAHTDQPKPDTFGRLRAWRALELRVAKIPVSVVLVLKGGNVPPKAPDSGTAKKVAQEVRRRLLASPHTSRIDAYGYTFVQYPARSANGIHAQFLAPSGVAGTVDASRLADAVDSKAAKYCSLSEEYEVPLLVAAGAHRFTRVDLDDVDRLLAGEQTISFQFSDGDSFIGEHRLDLGRPRRWIMPETLAGLLWIDNQPPFGATLRPNPRARRALPAHELQVAHATTDSVRVSSRD
jgi:hypothetical protein